MYVFLGQKNEKWAKIWLFLVGFLAEIIFFDLFCKAFFLIYIDYDF